MKFNFHGNVFKSVRTRGYNFSFTNPVPETVISVTKDWKKADGTTNYTPVEAEKTIKFKVFYKVDGDTTTGYPYTEDADHAGNYSIVYTEGTGWDTKVLQNLPMYVAITVQGEENSEETTTVTKKVSGYYVVEQETDGKQYTVTYKVKDGEPASICDSTLDGTITMVNTNAKITVTKTYSGVDALPAEFQITASWADPNATAMSDESIGESGTATTGTKSVVLTSTDATGDTTGLTITRTDVAAAAASGENPATPASYTWVIEGLPVGTQVTFTEANYSVAGYTWAGTVSVNGGTAVEGTSGSSTVAADGSAMVDFVNTYTPGVELPATGGPGTMIYTVAGLMLITLAGTLLVARKRKANR